MENYSGIDGYGEGIIASSQTISKKRVITPIAFFLLFLVMLFVTYRVSLWDDLDLHRNYEEAIGFAKKYSLWGMINYLIKDQVDFIYYVILYFAIKISIPLNIVTALIVSFYYVTIIACIKDIYKGNIAKTVLFAVMFATPFIWVVSISRNMTAVFFLYLGIRYYYKSKFIKAILFLTAGVFTHVSTLMYVAIFVASFLLQKIKLKPVFILLLIVGFYAVSVIMPDLLFETLTQFVSDQSDLRYARFAGLETGDVLEVDLLTAGEYLSMFFTLGFSIVLLFLNKNQGFEFWALFMLMVALVFFMGSFLMFVNRFMLVTPLFLGLNVASIYKDGDKKNRKIIVYLSYVGILIVLLYIYTNRIMFY